MIIQLETNGEMACLTWVQRSASEQSSNVNRLDQRLWTAESSKEKVRRFSPKRRNSALSKWTEFKRGIEFKAKKLKWLKNGNVKTKKHCSSEQTHFLLIILYNSLFILVYFISFCLLFSFSFMHCLCMYFFFLTGFTNSLLVIGQKLFYSH